LDQALGDADALVRRTAANRFPGGDAARLTKALSPLLQDPVLAVRIEAATRLAGLPAGPDLTAADFAATVSPTAVTVRRGAGVGGSDRVTLTWLDPNPLDFSPIARAVGNGWLTVTVKANSHTGLSRPDVFSFGNLIGETGDDRKVNALDLGQVKRLLNTSAGLDSRVDFNRDGRVNALDLGIVKKYLNRTLAPAVLPPPAGPAPATVEAEGATALLLEGGQMAPWKG